MEELKIPSMGGSEIGAQLYNWAAYSQPGTAIVELGTWMGAGTEHLARGAEVSGCTVHCFDRFTARGSEIDKARDHGISLRPRQDTLPLVKNYLMAHNNIQYHKTEIAAATWNGPKISVHVDDACKREQMFIKAIETFSPYWIPGGTIVVLMDYYWGDRHPDEPDAQIQKRFIEANEENFQHLCDWKGLSCSAFLYLGLKNIVYPKNT